MLDKTLEIIWQSLYELEKSFIERSITLRRSLINVPRPGPNSTRFTLEGLSIWIQIVRNQIHSNELKKVYKDQIKSNNLSKHLTYLRTGYEISSFSKNIPTHVVAEFWVQ